MKRFISTELFCTLREASQKGIEADAQVLENGYDKFVSLGLFNGYAGEAMLRLTALGHTNTSWMHLL